MSSALIDSFLDLLAPLGGVEAKRMFGGHGIMKQGMMIAIESRGRLFIKTDDLNRGVFIEAGCEAFNPHGPKRRKVILPYFEPPESAFINPQKMKPWAMLGWEAAQRAFQKRPASKKKARKSPAKKAS